MIKENRIGRKIYQKNVKDAISSVSNHPLGC